MRTIAAFIGGSGVARAFVGLIVCVGCTSTPAPSASDTPGPTIPAETGGACGDFTPTLASAAVGQPVDEPTIGFYLGSRFPFCRYVASGDPSSLAEATLSTSPRDDCAGNAQFMGMDPLDRPGLVAYQMGRANNEHDAFVIAWANSSCATVWIDSDGEQSTLIDAAATIAEALLL